MAGVVDDEEDEEQRWRVAGLVLLRIAPQAFAALLMAAEVIACETPEEAERTPRFACGNKRH